MVLTVVVILRQKKIWWDKDGNAYLGGFHIADEKLWTEWGSGRRYLVELSNKNILLISDTVNSRNLGEGSRNAYGIIAADLTGTSLNDAWSKIAAVVGKSIVSDENRSGYGVLAMGGIFADQDCTSHRDMGSQASDFVIPCDTKYVSFNLIQKVRKASISTSGAKYGQILIVTNMGSIDAILSVGHNLKPTNTRVLMYKQEGWVKLFDIIGSIPSSL